MKVLTIGAAGKYAGLIVPELKKRGVTVRALVRDESEIAAARERGADETATGDLRDSASLRAAAKGVDGVFHLNPAFAPDEAEMGVAMVEAAKAENVRKFVFSSVFHPSLSMINHAAKRPVEEALYESGMEFTLLQPAMFMQNFEGGWRSVVEQKKISMPYSKLVKMCYVDYRDVAEAAALALTGSALDYGTFELSSQGMFNRVELAALMSEALGQTVEAGDISISTTVRKSKRRFGARAASER
jgi:uncharacterized protein YbjT (DUF2867 family)